MKAILIFEMPKKCIDCPLVYKEDHFIYRCKVSEDQVDPNGIYRDCPLRQSSDYIPIEWILKWACEFIDPNSEGYKMAMELVHDWRKENEQAS